MGDRGMLWPAAVLAVAQMVHGVVPVDEDKVESESLVGLVVGAGLLALTVPALVGILQRRPYGGPLAAWTGLAVAGGFSAYHAVPWASAVTNLYLGELGGAPAWWSGGAG